MRSAGRYRDRVRVYTPITADDGRGGLTVSGYTAGDWVRAEIQETGGRDLLQAGGMRSAPGYAIECWSAPVITGGVRLYLEPQGVYAEVVEVRRVHKRRVMVIAAVEVDA